MKKLLFMAGVCAAFACASCGGNSRQGTADTVNTSATGATDFGGDTTGTDTTTTETGTGTDTPVTADTVNQ